MRLKISQVMLPDLYKTGTLRDMKEMAAKMALARKAISQIREIEDFLEKNAEKITERQLKLGMRETRDYARIVSRAVKEAMGFLNTAARKMEAYKRSLP